MTNSPRESDTGLAYEMAGTGSAVVLLHSGPCNQRMWDREFRALVREFRVIRYDHRGYGLSTPATKPFSHHDDLCQLADELKVQTAVLVGTSLGARTAVDFALQHPDRVEGLILVSPGLSGMSFEDPFIVEREEAMIDAIAHLDIDRLIELQLQSWVDGPHRQPWQLPGRVRQRAAGMFRENLSVMAVSTATPTELNAIERVSEIRCPVLVIGGELDSRDIHRVIARLADHPNVLTTLLSGCGHHVNLEQPGRFRALIKEFLGNMYC